MWNILRLLALRELWSHGVRSAVTAVGVAIGTAVVVAVLALNSSVLGGFQSMVNALAAGAELQIRGGHGGVPAQMVEQAAQVPGVAQAGAFLEGWLLDPTTGERVLLVGVDFLSDEPAPGLIEAGALSQDAMQTLVEDPFSFLNSTDAVILNQDYATRLNLQRHDTRRYVTPTGSREMKVAGVLPESAATRALGGAVALMGLDAAQLLLGKPDRVDVINLRLAKGAVKATVAASARQLLGDGVLIDVPERRTNRLAHMMLTLNTVMNMVSLVAILVGLFILQNTLTTSVMQRRRDIAIQRALGATRWVSRGAVMTEAAVLSLLGSLMGVPGGLFLASITLTLVTNSVSTLYAHVAPAQATLHPKFLVAVVVCAVVAGCVAALRPAHRATTVSPALALGGRALGAAPESGWRTSRSMPLCAGLAYLAWVSARMPQDAEQPWWGYLACVAVLASGVAAAQVAVNIVQALARPLAARTSVTMRLAVAWLTRDGSRGAKTASALMLGLSLYIGVNGAITGVKRTMLSWIDQAAPADLSVLEGSTLPDARALPMEPAVGLELAQDPGVLRVVRQRFKDLDLPDFATRVQALDMDGYLRHAQLPVVISTGPVNAAALEAGEVLISEGLANLTHLTAGDELQLPTPEGMRSFPIRAVVVDYSSEIGAVFMDWTVYANVFEDHMVDMFQVYLHDGADPETVRGRILAGLGTSLGVRVVTNRAFRTYVEDVVDDAFAATRALQLVAVLIALLGIINTLLAGIMDRIREIGVLRAVGASQRQVTVILTTEAVLLAVASAGLAAVVGTAFGWVFTASVAHHTTGWRIPFHFPLVAIVESAVLALVVATLAAALPARRGARIDILVATRSD